MDVKAYLEDSRKRVDVALDRALKDVKVSKNLFEAMSYSVNAGGKRVRPALAFAASEAMGEKAEVALPAAVALEMIHTYSLIHDDLPSMDNDDLRRGKPTNHKVYGEALAILAGDGLLTQAFYVLSDPEWKIPAERKVDITRIIADGAGSEGMVGGQVLDLEWEGKEFTEKTLEKIHIHKTGKLLRASVLAGARAAGADATTLEKLDRYAKAMGLSFQIADDVLDVTATTEQLGKDAQNDVKKKKATYPALMGVEKSKKRAATLLEEALEALRSARPKSEMLGHLARFIVERKS
jgi:geranylgeranyl diphosphate synthase, type II